jgi:protein involved in plasmid replication-relaxation
MSCLFRTATDRDALDIRLLHYRDRAVLRILDRAEAATPRQLAILVYGHRRVAQRQLARLWHAGLLERAIVPRAQRGGAELAYRLSPRARRKLGDRSTRARGSNRLGHTLDILETVCALVTANDIVARLSPVSAWLPESVAQAMLGTPPFPDSAVVLYDGGHSGVVCLEIDEGTQRRAVIEAKLRGYRRLFEANPTWQLLFVVPSATRARWLCTVARGAEDSVATRAWVTSLTALRSRQLDALVLPLDVNNEERIVRGLLTEPRERATTAPVGSECWVKILGEGGVEDLESLLW